MVFNLSASGNARGDAAMDALKWDHTGNVNITNTLSANNGYFKTDSSSMRLGNNQNNSWILHAPQDDRNTMFIAPGTKGDNWDWGKQVTFNKAGDVNVNGKFNVGGDVNVNGKFTVGGKPLTAGGTTVTNDIKSNSIGRETGDWFRIFGNTTDNGTALYGGLSVGPDGGRGLSVGAWDSKVPAGNINATGNVNIAGSLCLGPAENNWCFTPNPNKQWLDIRRNGVVGDKPDTGEYHLTQDGNLFLQRSTQQGWVADNIRNPKVDNISFNGSPWNLHQEGGKYLVARDNIDGKDTRYAMAAGQFVDVQNINNRTWVNPRGDKFTFQDDGNAVMYNGRDGKPKWASNTNY